MGALISINNTYDALYFFSCMNLLNTYVKKEIVGEVFAKRYVFKDYIVRGIEQVISKKIKKISILLDPEFTYVTLFNLQFSFHYIRPSSYLTQNFLNSSFNNRQGFVYNRQQAYYLNGQSKLE